MKGSFKESAQHLIRILSYEMPDSQMSNSGRRCFGLIFLTSLYMELQPCLLRTQYSTTLLILSIHFVEIHAKLNLGTNHDYSRFYTNFDLIFDDFYDLHNEITL